MSNPLKGEVPLHLSDGRELTLVFDMEAMIESESAYGKPLHLMLADASAGFMGAVRAMLYGALRARHPSITLQDASGMLTSDSAAINEALSKAHEAAMPAQSSASAEGKADRPAGKPSGNSGAKRTSNRKPSGAQPRARSR